MSANDHDAPHQHMGMLPDFSRVDAQIERLKNIETILKDPSIKAPEKSCLDCQFCHIIVDPDPYDEWNVDDEACYCSLLPKPERQKIFEEEHPLYLTKWYPFRFIVTGVRPRHMTAEWIDSVLPECPLNATDRFTKEQ